MKYSQNILNTVLLFSLLCTAADAAGIPISQNLLKKINTDGDENSFTINSDRNYIIFNRQIKDSQNSHLYFSELKKGKWSDPQPATELNSDSDDISPCISPNGKFLVFSSNRQGSLKERSETTPSYDIYFSEKKEGKWEKPLLLFGAVNTTADEINPYITRDGNSIIFTRYPAGESVNPVIIKVRKLNDSWEDVQTVSITDDKKLKPVMARDSGFRAGYIFTAYRDEENRSLYFSYRSGSNAKTTVPADSSINAGGDILSFCEIDSSTILVATNENSPDYNLVLKKIPVSVASKITPSDVDIFIDSAGYGNSGEIRLKLLYFESPAPESQPSKTEILTPGNSGMLKISTASNIKKIVVMPGSDDMKEFALIIYPDKDQVHPSIKIEKRTEETFTLKPIYFEFNSTELQLTDVPQIHRLIEHLRKNEGITLLINGYADGAGSCQSNRNISLMRAEKVKEYLVKRGIKKNRISTEGHGFIRNSINDTSQYNRRVEFILGE